MLFFGALFLPWLLGAPSEAVKLPLKAAGLNSEPEQEVSPVATDREPDVNEFNDIDTEQVYISKITPLDRNLDSTVSGSQDAIEKSVSKTLALSKPQKPEAKTTPNASAEKDTGSRPPSKSDQKVDLKLSSAQADTSSRPATTASATNRDPSIEVGWVVQVGVFTDKRGAAKVVEDLRDKGFIPSTSIVDTNRGKATGTRIWLGPYAQRVDAAKAKTLLTNKTGEAGFIRVYP